MRNVHNWGWVAAAVLGAAVVVLACSSPALSQRPAAAATIPEEIAADTGVRLTDVNKVLNDFGPRAAEHLARGETVDELPGLGAFRLVRIPEHRDLIGGRPATVAARNYVDFLPNATVVDAAAGSDVVPQEIVLPFEFKPLPNQTKSLHVPNERMPNVRTR